MSSAPAAEKPAQGHADFDIRSSGGSVKVPADTKPEPAATNSSDAKSARAKRTLSPVQHRRMKSEPSTKRKKMYNPQVLEPPKTAPSKLGHAPRRSPRFDAENAEASTPVAKATSATAIADVPMASTAAVTAPSVAPTAASSAPAPAAPATQPRKESDKDKPAAATKASQKRGREEPQSRYDASAGGGGGSAKVAAARSAAPAPAPAPVAPPSGPMMLTLPVTPILHTSRRQRPEGAPLPSDEEACLKALAESEMLAAERRRQNARIKKGVPPPALPARSHKPLTQPVEIKFATESRLRDHGVCTRAMGSAERVAADGEGASDDGPVGASHSPYKSLAQKVQDFQKKTPARFHTRPKYETKPILPDTQLKLTQAQEFMLRTTTRSRANSGVKSAAELEEEELKKMPKFRARPLDRKVLESCGDLGVPKVEKPPLTSTHEFKFQTDVRCAMHASPAPTEELPTFAPKTTKLDPRILEGPTFVASGATNFKPTVPTSPQLATEMRSTRSMAVASGGASSAEPFVFKAKAPQVEVAFGRLKPKSDDKPNRSRNSHPPQATSVKPFGLATETRGTLKKAQFESIVQEALHEMEASRAFKAKPLPASLDHPSVPPRAPAKEPTVPDPFVLESERLHEEAAARAAYERQMAAQADKEAATFHARPNRSATAAPFVPHKSLAPLTNVMDVKLQTEDQAAKRKEFDTKVFKKQAEAEAAREMYEREQKAAEEAAIKELRTTLVHHARPVPNFDNPFQPQRGLKEPTVPDSPNLGKSRPTRRCVVSGMR
eukprot:jgi/Mesvir1/22446/Mv17915-RA.1